MKVITKKFLYISFIVNVLKSCLVGATHFSLPATTPGLQQNAIPGSPKNCIHVLIPNTNCHLYFPTDGSQPDTTDAGIWSGARYNAPANEKNLVTNWWVRVFGGNKAVDLSRDGFPDKLNNAPEMGFNAGGKATHIIQVDPSAPAGFERQFWQTFRNIAADPIGRVLLYRLLIEIRRVDNSNHGCCGDGIILTAPYLIRRNNCRGLTVTHDEKSSFDFTGATLKLNPAIKQHRVLKQNDSALLTTDLNDRSGDVSLFHEMLHWFHYLRNTQRTVEGETKKDTFPYVARFYYGALLELNLWGLKRFNVKEEEMATILGIPDYNNVMYQNLMPLEIFPLENDGMSFQVRINGRNQYIPNYGRYLNGYDLSENAYRCSKTEIRVGHLYMRFGHSSKRNMTPVPMNPIPNRFQLAHRIATDCYLKITGNLTILQWRLIQGQAIK